MITFLLSVVYKLTYADDKFFTTIVIACAPQTDFEFLKQLNTTVNKYLL